MKNILQTKSIPKTLFSILICGGFCVFLFTLSPQFNAQQSFAPTQPRAFPTFAAEPTHNFISSDRIARILPDGQISVYIHTTSEVVYMDFEEYITGVLAAEMPASFELDALRAQAVAARSFILYRLQGYRAGTAPPEHNGADSCTNFAHCVAWTSIEDARERWGDNADYFESRIREAVNSTHGEYLTYNGNVARAFFFAMSNGRTENVEDVWNTSIPYLRSVASGDYSDLANFQTYAQIPITEFVERLRNVRPELLVGEKISAALGEITRTYGGRVGTIQIGNQSFRGTEIRQIFALRSADFDIESCDKYIHFTVQGFGHGVGLSQHGANRLAQNGLNYIEILKTYYTGVAIAR